MLSLFYYLAILVLPQLGIRANIDLSLLLILETNCHLTPSTHPIWKQQPKPSNPTNWSPKPPIHFPAQNHSTKSPSSQTPPTICQTPLLNQLNHQKPQKIPQPQFNLSSSPSPHKTALPPSQRRKQNTPKIKKKKPTQANIMKHRQDIYLITIAIDPWKSPCSFTFNSYILLPHLAQCC